MSSYKIPRITSYKITKLQATTSYKIINLDTFNDQTRNNWFVLKEYAKTRNCKNNKV